MRHAGRTSKPRHGIVPVAVLLVVAWPAAGRAEGHPLRAAGIAVAGDHSCAWLEDGSVRCWGSNESGAIGDGTCGDRSTPVRPVGLAGVVSVAVATGRSCALVRDGSMWCWGNGDDFACFSGAVLAPVRLDLPRPAIQIAVGKSNACALLDDGTTWCNGNTYDPKRTSPMSTWQPFRIDGLVGGIRLVMAGGNACSLDSKGHVSCWTKRHFPCGEEPTAPYTREKLALAKPNRGESYTGLDGPSRIVDLDSIADFLCARYQDGTRRCRSVSDDTRCPGKERKEPPHVPLQPPADAQLGDLCISRQGRAACYHTASFGLLREPAPFANLDRVRFVSGSYLHACAIRDDYTVWCWGSTVFGHLGDGTVTMSEVPLRVIGLPPVASVVAGAMKTCAVEANGTAWCWGINTYKVTGAERPTCPWTRCGAGRRAPARVLTPGPVARIHSGGDNLCITTSGGPTLCAGDLIKPERNLGPWATFRDPKGRPLLGIDLLDCRLYAMTAVVRGQLYSADIQGGRPLRARPSQERVPGTVRATGVQVRDGVLLTDGRVWHRGDERILPSDGKAVDLAYTNLGPCAIYEGGAVACDDLSQRLGRSRSQSRLDPLPGLPPVVQLAAGDYHVCALDGRGVVHCWGYDQYGQLGDGAAGSQRYEPAPVAGLPPVVEITAASYHTCARTAAGEVYCWGLNTYGQLGVGGETIREQPWQVMDQP